VFLRPLPEQFCFAFLWWKTILVTQFVLLLDAIILVRYLLIFWIRNPENFWDDFWCQLKKTFFPVNDAAFK
jgi:hypothetical protein